MTAGNLFFNQWVYKPEGLNMVIDFGKILYKTLHRHNKEDFAR